MHRCLLILFCILVGCSTGADDVVYAPPEEPEIAYYSVPGSFNGVLELCPDDLTFRVVYSYRNPNENIDKIHIRISSEQGRILAEDEASLNCPVCNMVDLLLQAQELWLNRSVIIDAWLIDFDGHESVVYTFEIFIKEC